MSYRDEYYANLNKSTTKTATAPATSGNKYEKFLTANGATNSRDLGRIRDEIMPIYNEFGTTDVNRIKSQFDQDSGTSPFDLLQGTVTGVGSSQDVSTSSGGSGRSYSGGGGSGGGGGAAGVAPDVQSAMQAYLQSIQAGQNPYGGYAERMGGFYQAPTRADLSWLDQVYNDGRVNSRYDALQGSTQDATQQNLGRVAGIRDDLSNRTGVARESIGAGFQDALRQIQDTGAQAAAAQGADVAGLQDVLSRFNAGSVQGESAPLANLTAANTQSMQGAAGIFDQALADRQSLAGNLYGDVATGMSQQEAALLSKIAADRADRLGANEGARAQATGQYEQQYQGQVDAARQAQSKLDADLWLKQMEWEAQQAQQLAAARLQAAQAGITV